MASSESRPLLLDVNALLAHAWPNHQFHRTVLNRLERRPAPEWATCALTQLGFVRLSSNPAIVGVRQTPAQALDVLARLVRDRRHRYVERLPPLGQVDKYFRRLLGHRQVTDAYLLAVAATNNAVLLTLDRRLTPTPPRDRTSKSPRLDRLCATAVDREFLQVEADDESRSPRGCASCARLSAWRPPDKT